MLIFVTEVYNSIIDILHLAKMTRQEDQKHNFLLGLIIMLVLF